MKTWPLEKFERMLNTLFSLDEEEEERSRPLRKAGSVYTQSKQAPQETDLSQLLRNEKHMPNDRLPCGDITIFRGYFIYVHDAEEKNKPVMTREYTKPQNDDEGEWPHLHSVPTPRCPFIADPVTNKPDDTERDSQAPAENQRAPDAPVTRAASAAVEARLMAKPTTAGLRKRPLELDAPREMAKPNQSGPFHSRNFEPPALKHYSTNTTNTTDTLPPQNRFQFQGMPKPGAGREPLASGLQQSNQTSAIQSQMISSTAANPGSRRPQTKEMHDLQRRAFVQRRGMSANTNDLRAAINNPPSHQGGAASRQTRLTTLSKIHENETQSDGEEDGSGKQPLATAKRSPKKKAAQRDMKPGYCENCRDKYEDFTEVSHRSLQTDSTLITKQQLSILHPANTGSLLLPRRIGQTWTISLNNLPASEKWGFSRAHREVGVSHRNTTSTYQVPFVFPKRFLDRIRIGIPHLHPHFRIRSMKRSAWRPALFIIHIHSFTVHDNGDLTST